MIHCRSDIYTCCLLCYFNLKCHRHVGNKRLLKSEKEVAIEYPEV